MAHDPRIERLLGEVELVQSRGDPARRRLCVMSLVALLAEEPHSDRPLAASPLIAAFARPINDAMDRSTRQRLVPFAPQIRGTSARHDPARREVLHEALMTRLLPRIATDLQVAARGHVQASAAEATARLLEALRDTPASRQPRLVQDPAWDGAALITPLRVALTAHRDGAGVQQAEAVARLIMAAASCVARPSRRAWYWDCAIGLLDTLCEVGRETPLPTPAPARDGRPVAA